MEANASVDFAPILSYDNIAIVILFVMCLAQWAIICKLLNSILSMKDVLQSLSNMISILNERLHNNND
jgi:hypothetical protein